jgi:hypothetical protein
MTASLVRWIKSLWNAAAFWRGPDQPVSDAIAPTGHNRKPRKSRKVQDQTVGEFHFREAILDQLENYFLYLRRMKHGDREAYNLYQKLGAHVIPYRYPKPGSGKLPRWWAERQPTFGAVAFAVGEEWADEERKQKSISPRFLYFSKYKASKRPGTIEQYSKGSVYVLTVYWDDGKKKGGYPAEYAVGVDPDGTVHVLRTLNSSVERPKSRGKNGQKGKAAAIPVRRWGIDPYWNDCVARPTEMGETPEQFMKNLFCWVADLFERANASMTRVAVKKDGMKAIFSVGIERTPYFFRDRDRDDNGQRKKIFHIVRAHRREVGGKQQAVRTHFRGEREFDWNGYQVEITVPGWHHFDMMDFNVEGHSCADDEPKTPDTIEGGEVADFLNNAMKNGEGGEHARRHNGASVH